MSDLRPSHRSWLAATRTVAGHEARASAHAPMTGVFLAGFLLTLGAAVFLVGDLYQTDVASADLLWTFLPWAALVFVPALAMASFADGAGDRSLELIASLPLPASAVVAGKWAAGTGLLALALSGTFPIVATIAYLGAPDWGVVASGYVGAALLLAAFYAIALAAAALTREPIAAYVVGLGLLLLALVAGWDVAMRQAQGGPLEPLLAAAATLSPKLWLDRAATGRLEAGAFAATAIIVGGALSIACWALTGRAHGRAIGRLTTHGVAAALVALAAALLVTRIAASTTAGLDLTAEREFTVHPETANVARGLPPGSIVDIYWSSRDASIPASVRLHARRARDLLRAIAAKSGGKLTLVEHDVTPDSDEETRALTDGIRRIPLSSGGSFVLGISARHGERKGAVPYLDIGRDRHLEHDIATLLAGLTRTRTPRVAILSPLLLPRHATEPRDGLASIEDLKRNFDIAIVPHFADTLPEDLDAVVVIGASLLKRSMLHALDQHAMRGKGLVVMVDPYTRFNKASDAAVPAPSADVNDITDLLAAWGLRFEGDGVVGDRTFAAQVAGEGERSLAYPFWLQLRKPAFAAAHRATAALNEMLLIEPGSFTITRPQNAEPLLTTSGQAGTLPRAAAAGKSTVELAADFKPDGTPRTLAAALRGPLPSAFAAAPGPTTAHIKLSPATVAVYAIADVDWLFDPAALQTVGPAERPLTRPLNDNTAFLLNLVEMAAGDPRLVAIRTRGTQQRPFTRVATLLAASQARYRDAESAAAQKIAKVEGDIAKVLQIAKVDAVEQLPADIQARIAQLRADLAPHRAELRRLRAIMREDVERLGARLTAVNLAAPLLLALLFAAAMRALRRRRARGLAS